MEDVPGAVPPTLFDTLLGGREIYAGSARLNPRKALEKIDGIEEAVASHTAGTAVITCSKDVDEALIREAIEDRDYKYLGME